MAYQSNIYGQPYVLISNIFISVSNKFSHAHFIIYLTKVNFTFTEMHTISIGKIFSYKNITAVFAIGNYRL